MGLIGQLFTHAADQTLRSTRNRLLDLRRARLAEPVAFFGRWSARDVFRAWAGARAVVLRSDGPQFSRLLCSVRCKSDICCPPDFTHAFCPPVASILRSSICICFNL